MRENEVYESIIEGKNLVLDFALKWCLIENRTLLSCDSALAIVALLALKLERECKRPISHIEEGISRYHPYLINKSIVELENR